MIFAGFATEARDFDIPLTRLVSKGYLVAKRAIVSRKKVRTLGDPVVSSRSELIWRK